MTLFSKDTDEIRKISRALQDCGCCTRCTLRYLGLRETHNYRKSLQEIKEELKGLTDPDEGSNLLKGSETGETNTGLNEEIVQNNSGDCKTESVNTGEIICDASLCNDALSEAKSNPAEGSREVTDKSVNTAGNTRDTNDSNSEHCNGSLGTEILGSTKVNDIGAQTSNLITDSVISSQSSCEIMDTSKPSNNDSGQVVEKPDSCKEKETSHKSSSEKRLCTVCLGILEDFTSDEFLQRIKVSSVDEGFEFTNYICSLKIPVSIILREHAIILFLKDTFGSVYNDVKFLDIPTIKDVWKWRNGPILKEILGAPFDQKSTFDIILNFVYPDSDRECSFLLGLMSDTFRKRKQDRRNNKKGAFQVYNRANVTKAVLDMSTIEFKSHFQVPPRVPTKPCTCDIKCQNEAIFIAGRYNKYSRTLSQTPWVIEGQRKSESSVEELICTEIDKAFRPTEHKFSSAGREDVDVLMLGDGRPFIVELTNPRRVNFTQEDMTNIQTLANDAAKDIRVTDLQIVSREETDKLKEGEIDKIKNYSALCWSKSPLSTEQLNKLTELKDLKILQKTPIRVLHRRPLSTREKCIHSMMGEKVDEYHFRLGLKTQAGTYIKEFVHGDFGRTKPNLTELLSVDCDILELDVQSVELDWPKKIG